MISHCGLNPVVIAALIQVFQKFCGIFGIFIRIKSLIKIFESIRVISQINLHTADIYASDTLRLKFFDGANCLCFGFVIGSLSLGVYSPGPSKALLHFCIPTPCFNTGDCGQQMFFDLIFFF